MITSPLSFVASANGALYEGARPVFADVDPGGRPTSPPEAAEAVITECTEAILPVQIFGDPAEMGAFEALP